MYNAQLEIITNVSAKTVVVDKAELPDRAETRVIHTTLNSSKAKSRADEDALQRRVSCPKFTAIGKKKGLKFT